MRKINLFLFSIATTLTIHAQWKETSLSIPSPNAASLGVYGEIPVTHFTGTPNISIPIYEIKGKHIGLPISLSYHPGGVRPDAHPGWTGLGWNLFAGGAITRKMNRMPDELQATQFGSVGYFFKYDKLNNSGWASNLNDHTKYPLTESNGAVSGDIEPDEFSFSFLGYSGKFFLDHTGVWRIQSDHKLQVKFQASDFIDPFIISSSYGLNSQAYITKTFKKFVIIDEQGNKYTFGGEESAIEYSDEMTPSISRRGELFFATSWFLTKIESGIGNEVINLNYIRGPFTSFLFRGYNSMFLKGANGGFMDPGCTNYSASNVANGRVISPVYLNSIEMPKQNLLINFSASKSNDLKYTANDYHAVIMDNYGATGVYDFDILEHTSGIHFDDPNDAIVLPLTERFIWRKLDQISILNSATAEIVKKINFNYTEASTRRLRLNNLTAQDQANNNIYNYSFSYKDDNLLPEYFKKIGDHWGYHNNIDLPNGIAGSIGFLTLRQPDENYTKAEILKEIKYPTGGTTEFEFELNKYSSVVAQDRLFTSSETGNAGGLRIKRIITKDGTGKSITKEYYYVKNYLHNSNVASLESSGILDVKPKYTFSNLTGIDYAGFSFIYSFTSSNPVIPVSLNSTGTHIGYTEVVEKIDGNGYSILKFTNHDNGFTDNVPVATFNRNNVAYYPFCSRDFERGRLLSKYDYRNDGKILLETINEYSRINEANKAARAVENSFFSVCSQSAGRQAVSRSAYLLYYYPFVITKQIVKQYSSENDNNTYVKTEKTFQFDDYKNIVEEAVLNKIGDLITTRYKYPYDFNTGTTNNPYYLLLQNNNVSEVVERRVFREKVNGYNLLSAQFNTYKIYSPTTVLRDKTYEFLTRTPVVESALAPSTYTTSNGLILDNQYTIAAEYVYNSDGNLTETKKFNDISTAYTWQTYTLPTSQTTNAKHNEVFFEAFENLNGWDASLSFDNSKQRTGRYSGKIEKKFTGEKVSYSSKILNLSLTGITKYKISGWVFSDRPSVDIHVLMKRANELNPFTYDDLASTTTTGQWVYIEKDVSVPADVVTLSIRLDNNGGGTVWFDDIRLHPANAQMTTYTYNFLNSVTSQTDLNNRTTYYDYDQLGRLQIIRDNDKNVIKKFCYSYWNEQVQCSGDMTPTWQSIGERCKPCDQDPDFITNMRQSGVKDMNVNSNTYGEIVWTDLGVNNNLCYKPTYQSTGTWECVKNNDLQTGDKGYIVKDMNPCSDSYNSILYSTTSYNCFQCPVEDWEYTGVYECLKDANNHYTGFIKWQVYKVGTCNGTEAYRLGPQWLTSYNGSVCPVPIPCNSPQCTGEDKKCVNGVCETGVKVYTSCLLLLDGSYKAKYRYEWSDGSWSLTYTSFQTQPCY